MKILLADKVDRKRPGLSDEVLIAENVSEHYVETIVMALNAVPDDNYFFQVVPDNHKLRKFLRAAESRVCGECGRLRPQLKPQLPMAAVTHCECCHGPFSLDEIAALFHEANMSDSNHARQLRRVLVDDLIAALRAGQAVKVSP